MKNVSRLKKVEGPTRLDSIRLLFSVTFLSFLFSGIELSVVRLFYFMLAALIPWMHFWIVKIVFEFDVFHAFGSQRAQDKSGSVFSFIHGQT